MLQSSSNVIVKTYPRGSQGDGSRGAAGLAEPATTYNTTTTTTNNHIINDNSHSRNNDDNSDSNQTNSNSNATTTTTNNNHNNSNSNHILAGVRITAVIRISITVSIIMSVYT